MQLSIKDVAELVNVSENTVYGWIQEDNMPVEQVKSLYRVNPAELLEWATTRRIPVSPAIFRKMNGDSVEQNALTAALEAGGVIRDIAGHDRRSIMETLVNGLSLPAGFAKETLIELLLARERLCSTGIGEGIAIPHPRNPIVLPGAPSVLRIGFLQQPIDFDAADGKPVDILFLMICPTVHVHLQLLARLGNVLQHDSFRKLLAARSDKHVLLEALQTEEQAIVENSAI